MSQNQINQEEDGDDDVLKDRYFDINGIQVPKRTMWTKGGTEFINGISFQCQGSFGCLQTLLNKNVYMFTDSKIIYLCGKHVVIFDVITKEMTFLQKNMEDDPVTAFNYYYKESQKGPRLLIAVGLGSIGKSLPQAKIYKSHKSFNSSLVISHLGMQAIIIDIGFLQKKQFVITLTKVFTDNSSVITVWDRKKETALKNIQIKEQLIEKLINVTLSHDQFTIQGPKLLEIWHYCNQEINRNEIVLIDNLNGDEEIIDTAYIPKTPYLGAITTHNNLHFLKNDVYLQKIEVEIPMDLLIEDYQKENFFLTEGMDKQQARDFYSKKEDVQTYLITCICPVRNGFVIGFAGIPLLIVYRINLEQDLLEFQQILKFNFPNAIRIHSMHCSPDDQRIIISVQHTKKGFNSLSESPIVEKTLNKLEEQHKTGRSKKYQLLKWFKHIPQSELGRQDIYLLDYYKITSDQIQFYDPFSPIFEQGVNSDEVFGIGICPSKSLFLTISKDKSLKIWYFNHLKGIFHCDQSQTFNENPLAISTHPLTIQCAIGFKDSVKLFFLLEDGLKPAFSTQLKECRSVNYSETGHMLAAANSNIINIYNPYTFELINQLNGHNAPIKQIEWRNQDKYIKSVCQAGVIIIWDYYEEKPYLQKADPMMQIYGGPQQKQTEQHLFAALEYDSVYDLLLATTYDKKIKIYGDKGTNLIYEHETAPYIFTAICILQDINVILFGTNTGGIRMYLWPFDFSLNIQEHSETAVHQQDVSVIQPSPDLKYLITGSIDGSLFFINMKEYVDGHEVTFNQHYQQYIKDNEEDKNKEKEKESKQNEKYYMQGQQKGKENTGLTQQKIKRKNLENIYTMNNIAISSFTSQEWLTDKIKELEFRIQNLTHDIEDEKEQLQKKTDFKYKENENVLKNKYNVQKQQDDMQYDEIKKRYEELKKKKQVSNVDWQNELLKIQKESEQSLLNHYKFQDLLKNKIKEIKEYQEKQIVEIKQSYEEELEKATQEEEQNYNELQSQYQKALQNIKLDERKFEEAKNQLQWENEYLLKQTQDRLEQQKQQEEQIAGKLRDQISKKSKEVEKFHKRINSNQLKKTDVTNQIESLEEQNKIHRIKKREFDKDLGEKEEIIKTKESEIKSYRNINQHLQNYRAVYDYRVQTLQEERMPLADHLNDIEKNIKVMYKELLDEAADAKKMKSKLENSNDQIVYLKQQLKAKQDLVNYCKQKVKRFEYEISFMLRNKQIEEWPQQMGVVMQNFFQGENSIERLVQKNKDIGTQLGNEKIDDILKNMNLGIEEQQKIELVNDRDQQSKKMSQMNKINKQKEDDKGSIVIRVQNQNTELLTECNSLREERKKLQEKIQQLQKAFKLVELENQRLDKNYVNITGKQKHGLGNKKNGNESFAADLDSFLQNTTNILNKPKQINFQKQNNALSRPVPMKPTVYQKYQDRNTTSFKRSSSAGRPLPPGKSPKSKPQEGDTVFLTQLMQDIQNHKLSQQGQSQDRSQDNHFNTRSVQGQPKLNGKINRSFSPLRNNNNSSKYMKSNNQYNNNNNYNNSINNVKVVKYQKSGNNISKLPGIQSPKGSGGMSPSRKQF